MRPLVILMMFTILIIGFVLGSSYTDAQVGNYYKRGDLTDVLYMLDSMRDAQLYILDELRREKSRTLLYYQTRSTGWALREMDESGIFRPYMKAVDWVPIGEADLQILNDHITILRDMNIQ